MKFTKKILLMLSLIFSLVACKDITNATLPTFAKNTQVKLADIGKATELAAFMKEDYDFIVLTDATKYTEGILMANTNLTINNPKFVNTTFDMRVGDVNLHKISPSQYRSTDQDNTRSHTVEMQLQKEKGLELGNKFSQGNLAITLNSKEIGNINDNLTVPACVELKKTNSTDIVKNNGYTLEWLGQPDNTRGVVIEISQPFATPMVASRYIVCEDKGSYTFSPKDLVDYQVFNPQAQGNEQSRNDVWVSIYRGNYKMITSTEGYKFKVIAYSKANTRLKVY
jgi:hypothetical protein